jgi:hypothetical protein
LHDALQFAGGELQNDLRVACTSYSAS